MRNKGYLKILTIQYRGAKEESFSPDCQPSESGFRKTYLPVHTRCSKSNKRPMGMQFDRSSMLGSTNRCGLCFHEDIPL